MAEALYMDDSYLKEWDATVQSVSQKKFIVLDKTAFYPKGGGVEALGEGRAEIGTTSRPVKQSEREQYPDVDFHESLIGFYGVAVIVSEELYDAGVTDFSAGIIKDIFIGEITNWAEVGGPDQEIEVHEFIEGTIIRDHFMNRLNLDYTITHYAWETNDEMKDAVEQSDNAIGYIDLPYVGPTTPALMIDDVYPSAENIRDGLYLISSPLIMYTNGPPEDGPDEYIRFVYSPQGQQIVEELGFVSIG